jgi:aminodeoxyfutalosine deaminase
MSKNQQIKSIIHRAGFVVSRLGAVYENGYVLAESGIIKEVGVYSDKIKKNAKITDPQVIDHGDGAIIPSLANVHTHLELSAFKGKLPLNSGFKNWVKNLLIQRDKASQKDMIKAADNGIKEILNSGCLLCGEISTIKITKDLLLNSKLYGVWFEEVLGEKYQEKLECETYKNKKISYAGHAPHTTSPELLFNLKNATQKANFPFSIHLCESEDEDEFIKTGKGDWALFLKERGIDFNNWNLPAKSPVVHLENSKILNSKTIAVHMITADKKDYEILKKHNVSVCLCTRSNKNIHKRLPDINSMIKAGINLCLGTDSLASVDSLNIFDEMSFIFKNFPAIAPEKIFEMASINGAKALGFEEKLGSLEKGKKASFFYVPIKAKNVSSVMERIVCKDF